MTKWRQKPKDGTEAQNGIRKLCEAVQADCILSEFIGYFLTRELTAFVLNFTATRKQECDHVMDRRKLYFISTSSHKEICIYFYINISLSKDLDNFTTCKWMHTILKNSES